MNLIKDIHTAKQSQKLHLANGDKTVLINTPNGHLIVDHETNLNLMSLKCDFVNMFNRVAQAVADAQDCGRNITYEDTSRVSFKVTYIVNNNTITVHHSNYSLPSEVESLIALIERLQERSIAA